MAHVPKEEPIYYHAEITTPSRECPDAPSRWGALQGWEIVVLVVILLLVGLSMWNRRQ